MLNPTTALFRQAVLARKRVLAYDAAPGQEKAFRQVLQAYWAASARYADASQMDYFQARQLITIAAKAA